MWRQLYDDEHNAMFDEIWYVYTSVENRIKRLMASRGYSEEKCRGIMANQASEDDYRSFATRVLDNNGGIEDIRKQIASFLGRGLGYICGWLVLPAAAAGIVFI